MQLFVRRYLHLYVLHYSLFIRNVNNNICYYPQNQKPWIYSKQLLLPVLTAMMMTMMNCCWWSCKIQKGRIFYKRIAIRWLQINKCIVAVDGCCIAVVVVGFKLQNVKYSYLTIITFNYVRCCLEYSTIMITFNELIIIWNVNYVLWLIW